LAALVFAWHPGVVDEVRVGRPYGATVLFAALAFWVTARWKKQPQSHASAFAWVAANAGLLWTHYVNLPAILLQLVVLVGLPGIGSRTASPPLSRSALATLALFLVSAPLVPSVLRVWEWSPFLNFMTSPTALWQVLGSLWWAGLPAGWLLARVCSLRSSSATSAMQATQGLPWLLVWSVVPVLGIAVVSRGDWTSLAAPRYQIAFAVPAACFVTACIAYRTTRVAACLGSVTAIAVAWLAAGTFPWESQRLQPDRAGEWAEMAAIVEQSGQPGEPIFVQSGLVESSLVPGLYRDAVFMDYTACRLGRFYLKTPHPRYGLPFFWESADVRSFFGEVLAARCHESDPTIWIAAATDTDLNSQSLAGIEELLAQQGYKADLTERFKSAVLARFRCGRANQ
jgi:hypothetical protein